MDQYMDEFCCVETYSVEEYDPDYEFEAPRYFDLSRMETAWEVEEAERWFDSAGTYPPSPFIAKMNWGKGLYVEAATNIEEENHDNMNSIHIDPDCIVEQEIPASVQHSVEQTRILPKQSVVKPCATRTSTLMKPTASHLAKQRACQEIQFNRLSRSQRSAFKDQETTSQHSSIAENYATKRQKLEAGYLRKAADLKHRAVLQHKLSNKVKENGDLPQTRFKVTVPREPRLETANRALRRSNCAAESAESTKSNLPSSKVQKSNSKVQTCHHKKVTAQSAELQIADTRNPLAASWNGEKECKRSTLGQAKKLQKCEVKHKLRARSSEKDPNVSPSRHGLTISLFQKLTLESEDRTKSKSQSKPLKENAPSTQQVQEVVKVRKEKQPTSAGKQLTHGRTRRIPQ